MRTNKRTGNGMEQQINLLEQLIVIKIQKRKVNGNHYFFNLKP